MVNPTNSSAHRLLISFFSKIAPFNQLPSVEITRLSLMARVAHHKKGETLYNEGDEASSVWALQAGRLAIFKYTSTGRPLAIETINPDQLFGTLCRLGGATTTYPCTAIACCDSVSVQVPDKLFQNLYQRFPAMVSSACRLCSVQLSLMNDRAATSQEPALQRIVKTLMALQLTNGNELPFTRREISELSATTVETTIRVLSRFEKKRWIASHRGLIRLLDIPRLQACLA
jgi:CRP/FNR family transcriptional regulator